MDLKRYLSEAELALSQPSAGDEFDITINEVFNLETEVLESNEDGITLAMDERGMAVLEELGIFEEEQLDEILPAIGAVVGRALAGAAGKALGGTAAAGRALGGTAGKIAGSALGRAAGSMASNTLGALGKAFSNNKSGSDDSDDASFDIGKKMAMADKFSEDGSMDKSSGSPYDRGGADAYYGRKFNPHKMIANPAADAPKGSRVPAPLTDPKEIEAYRAGWNDEDGRKDYGENIEEAVNEDIVQHPTHGAVYGKDGKAKLFMTRSEAEQVADAMAKKHAGSTGISIVQGPYTGYLVKMPESEQTDEAGVGPRMGAARRDMEDKSPEELHNIFMNVATRFGDTSPANLEKLARERAWRYGYGKMSDHYWKQFKHLVSEGVNEAEYQGRSVQLGKPTRGDVKKYKVYVRDPKSGNIKKVNFGDKNMEIKRDNPERRKNFRARHNCSDKKDRTKAGYWSCRMWSKKPVSKIV